MSCRISCVSYETAGHRGNCEILSLSVPLDRSASRMESKPAIVRGNRVELLLQPETSRLEAAPKSLSCI